jgi:hypothetical protein
MKTFRHRKIPLSAFQGTSRGNDIVLSGATTPLPTTLSTLRHLHSVTPTGGKETNVKFSWEKLTPAADPEKGFPCKRSSHGLSLLQNGKLLILYGGEEVARTPMDDLQSTWAVEQKNDGTWSWRCIDASPTPPPRVGHAQCVYNDSTIYAFGGRAGIQMEEAAMNDLWRLDCSKEPKWSLVQPDLVRGDPPPEARSFHKMLCVGSFLYVFGGCGSDGRLADLHQFDITNNTWKVLPSSSLSGRGGANFIPFSSQTLLGVVAGFCGEESNDGQCFDTSTEKWTEAKQASELLTGLRPRSVCVSTSFPSLGVAIIFGGEVDPSDKGHEGAGGFENDIVLLDETDGTYIDTIAGDFDSKVWPETRGWSDGAAIEDARNGQGKLYLYGGLSGNDSDPKRLSDLWCLNIQK